MSFFSFENTGLRNYTMKFKGGGGGGMPYTPAPSAPPATQTNVEVVQAKRDTRLQAKKRKGFQSTILAGETGGYNTPDKGMNTLLGGG